MFFTRTKVALPEFVWGSPEDVNTASVEALKNAAIAIEFPAFIWGDPQDVDAATLAALKID